MTRYAMTLIHPTNIPSTTHIVQDRWSILITILIVCAIAGLLWITFREQPKEHSRKLAYHCASKGDSVRFFVELDDIYDESLNQKDKVARHRPTEETMSSQQQKQEYYGAHIQSWHPYEKEAFMSLWNQTNAYMWSFSTQFPSHVVSACLNDWFQSNDTILCIATDDVMEGGMPCTRGNAILLPPSFRQSMVDAEQSGTGQTGQEKRVRLCLTLCHEVIHILQRHYRDEWQSFYETFGIYPYHNIRQKIQQKSPELLRTFQQLPPYVSKIRRTNPDTYYDDDYIYQEEDGDCLYTTECYNQSTTLRDSSFTVFSIKRGTQTKKIPRILQKVSTCKDLCHIQIEHPHEWSACIIAAAIVHTPPPSVVTNNAVTNQKNIPQLPRIHTTNVPYSTEQQEWIRQLFQV